MQTSTIRTRFAPSPTGYLHIGGVRTALFNWLYARKYGGQFILRIEDTDRERSTAEAVNAILDAMKWLGLESDEAVTYQSDRLARYREIAETLLSKGRAYRCQCSQERLDTLRQQQIEKKIKPRYDGRCREMNWPASDKPSVIRFCNPLSGSVTFQDQVYGEITVNNEELDDLVLIRSDGFSTYNFSVVIDDTDMNITHVIRGDDHINNTPRQINLLNALQWLIPTYVHLPMLLGEDGKRLSKRHGATNVLSYREQGYLPDALINYLSRLGWSQGDQEIFHRDELIKAFDLKNIHKSPARTHPEKLLWLNHHYIQQAPLETLATELIRQFESMGIHVTNLKNVQAIVELQRDRCKTLQDMAMQSQYFFTEVTDYDPKACEKFLKPEIKPALKTIIKKLADLQNWEPELIHKAISDTVQEYELKFPKLAQPIRIAVTGGTMSPSIDQTLYWLSQEITVQRLSTLLNIF